MKKENIPFIIIAILAVLSFMLVGVAIGYRSVIGMLFFLVLGFAMMGIGFSIKRKQRVSNT
ncbi:DUF5325 family protein [Pontibacillus litoralis]|uniref:Uncharacterized protein n=1 Tax=Pontibacillus litoralis JSM 072002 TaxID=1385512 RepID=A0A0A5GC43_9BACI|nr:DUF5325 family protein [Pontibacillus litoralis]KGX88773.1 hypothetical protein N784_00025 [Pontibacillus litoralis JSM 072002]